MLSKQNVSLLKLGLVLLCPEDQLDQVVDAILNIPNVKVAYRTTSYGLLRISRENPVEP